MNDQVTTGPLAGYGISRRPPPFRPAILTVCWPYHNAYGLGAWVAGPGITQSLRAAWA